MRNQKRKVKVETIPKLTITGKVLIMMNRNRSVMRIIRTIKAIKVLKLILLLIMKKRRKEKKKKIK